MAIRLIDRCRPPWKPGICRPLRWTRAGAMMSSRTYPITGWALLTLGLGTAVLVGVSAWPLTRWAYADWTAASSTTREALVYAGPWVAGCSAWASGRYLGHRSLTCLPSASRSGAPVVWAQLAMLGGAAVVGQVVGLAPMLVQTRERATAGSLDGLVALGSVAVLLTFCGFGYLLGCLLPRAASVFVAVAAAFSVILAVDTWGLALAPLWLWTPAAGQQEVDVVASFRAAFFFSLAVAFAVSSARWVEDRTSVRLARNYRGLALLLPSILIGAVAHTTAPPAIRAESEAPSVCADALGVPVCVHRAKEPLLEPLSDGVSAALQVVGGRPAVPVDLIADASLRPDRAPGVVVLDLQAQEQNWLAWAVGDLAGYLSGRSVCADPGRSFTADAEPGSDPAAAALAFASWISNTAGFDAPQLMADRSAQAMFFDLEARPRQDVVASYHRYAAAVATCTLTPDMLP